MKYFFDILIPMTDKSIYSFFKGLLVCALLFVSCDDDLNEELPPITMDGRNTFGCLVTGKVWLAKGQSGSNGIFVDMTVPNFLSISADNAADHTGMSLVFNDSNFEVNKVYTLSSDAVYYSTYNYRVGQSVCFYEYQHVVSGTVVFSKIENQLISGTFEFITYNPDCGDTIEVKEGRFDIGSISN